MVYHLSQYFSTSLGMSPVFKPSRGLNSGIIVFFFNFKKFLVLEVVITCSGLPHICAVARLLKITGLFVFLLEASMHTLFYVTALQPL